MRRGILLALSGAWLGSAACAGSVSTPPAAAPPEQERPVGAATITPADFYARVSFLASDALRGRQTPSPGLNAAAAYLVSEYQRLGLAPGGEGGTFYQWWPFPQVALDTTTVHFGSLLEGADNRMLRYGVDFVVDGVPALGQAAPGMAHAHLSFVGELGEAGLPAGDYRGATPLVVVPGPYGRAWSRTVASVRDAAEQAGAAGLAVVVDPEVAAEAFPAADRQARAPRRLRPGSAGGIPVFYLTREAAAGLVARGGQAWDRLPRSAGGPMALQGVDAHFAATLRPLGETLAPNVAAVLPGSDPELRDEYVILSAHMDHVGVGRPVDGDSIYNGADDDASGTAALVEIAEALASLPERPARSILFLHVSGEEHGLLGSRWYSDHPTVPLESVVANINIDMIGRNAPDSVVVIGKDYSSLGQVVEAVGARRPDLGLVVSDDLWPEERFFFRSDHFNFARKEIPALFFFTGVHEDYHRPSDEVEKLNVGKASRIAQLIYYTLIDIADAPERPVWDPEGLEEVRALTRSGR